MLRPTKLPCGIAIAVFTVLIGLAGAKQASADTTYSGRAIGAYVDTLLTGPITISDTGNLPSAGGWNGACLLTAGVPNVLSAKVLVGATSGTHEKAFSSASLADLTVLPGSPTELSASFVRSQTFASCEGVKGSSEIADLKFCGLNIEVTGKPNQKVSLLGATLIINEQVDTSSGDHHEIRVNALHLVVPGVAEVILASSKSDVTCGDGGGHGPCYDFVTGGGWITGTPSGEKGNFGFNAGLKPNATSPTVAFNYVDHDTGMHVKATSITLYKATTETGRHFEGACTINGVSGFKYSVTVEDNGEPGKGVDKFAISLTNGYSASGLLAGGNIQLHAFCTLKGLKINPTIVCGGNSAVGTVTLLVAAPEGGLKVDLTSSHPGVASVPASITIPAGKTSATFPITSVEVAAKAVVKITATADGETKTANLTVMPPGLVSVTVSPGSICGGNSVVGKVTIGCKQDVDVVVKLVVNLPEIVLCPVEVTIPAGSLSATFAIKTKVVAVKTLVKISASQNGVTKVAALTVKASTPTSVICDPTSLIGGLTCLGKVTVDCPAPAGGLIVKLKVDLPELALRPLEVVIPEGEISATFVVKTVPCLVTTLVKINATVGGVTKTATLTVKAAELLSLKLSVGSILGGKDCFGLVDLTGPAPKGGLTIKLSSSHPLICLVPASCFIPEGETSAKFDIKTNPVAALTSVVISATLGSITKTATLQVKLF